MEKAVVYIIEFCIETFDLKNSLRLKANLLTFFKMYEN